LTVADVLPNQRECFFFCNHGIFAQRKAQAGWGNGVRRTPECSTGLAWRDWFGLIICF
jgi:hypothetical protein